MLKDGEENSGLCAYVVGKKNIPDRELREHLAASLPVYMLPSHYVWLDALPLSDNGKIDRRSLPNPTQHILKERFEKPESETAQAMAEIWKGLLGVERVGLRDNFFDLGGHSLKATTLVAKMYKKWGIEVPLESVFRYPLLTELTEIVEKLKTNNLVREDPVMKLNNGQHPIFCFPPVAGFGFEFKSLAEHLSNYEVYAFDFIEEDDRLERYVSVIKSIQPEGPYTILGYSAGGHLGFEVAKAIELSGDPVSKLIIIDAERKNKIDVTSSQQIEKETDVQLQLAETHYKELLAIPALRQKVKNRIKNYRAYLEETINEGFINADIMVICSESTDGLSWAQLTKGRHQVYKGFGKHTEMLSPTYAAKHAEILQSMNILV
ncbi:thioesterase domain-containing protein [Lysinibacillus sphaericus]